MLTDLRAAMSAGEAEAFRRTARWPRWRAHLVSKDELLELVWPGVVVEESSLQVQIWALRKLLGSQVIVTVPGRSYQFTAAPTATSAVAAAAAIAPAATPVHTSPGRRGHLLVADDNKVNRLLLCRTLELLGHRVASVENGSQALQALRSERHDLLLLDLEMPEVELQLPLVLRVTAVRRIADFH